LVLIFVPKSQFGRYIFISLN